VDQNTFEFVLLLDGAKVPRKATLGSTGFDVYSPREVTIHAQKTMKVPLDLSISPPEGTYTRTAARSSLATHHQIICPADVIDPNYTGCIHMCLTNLSDRDYTVQKHQKIGSPVFEHAERDPKRLQRFQQLQKILKISSLATKINISLVC
jgi:deoxyuridine 5'-triphosphate nucleotidohydrolase